MVYNNSFAVERGWFVVCLEPAFKNSQTIFHRVLHYHLHSPISHVLGGRVQERQSLSSSLIPPPSLSRCQSPPPTPLPDTNSSTNCSGKNLSQKPWQAKAATIYSKFMVRDNSLSRAKSKKSEGKAKKGWPGKPQETLFPGNSGALWRKKARTGHG